MRYQGTSRIATGAPEMVESISSLNQLQSHEHFNRMPGMTPSHTKKSVLPYQSKRLKN